MTIKDLPVLDPIQAHFLNSQPLPNEFSTHVQSTKYYNEAKNRRASDYKFEENKLAYLLKFNGNAAALLKDGMADTFGQDVISNAQRHLTNLIKRTNVPAGLQIAAIAWYIEQIIDIDKTIAYNKWK